MVSLFSKGVRQQLAGIDLRTLALFRVMLAVCIIADILILWPDAGAFLSDGGLYPLRKTPAMNGAPYWSLYAVSGHAAWSYLLMALTLLSALALLFGYHARLAAAACWLLIASLNPRIMMLTSAADTQLCLLLFWAMFLPLGARFSVDAALSKLPRGDNAYASPATFALLVQGACLYLFSALHKTGPLWHASGLAVEHVLTTPVITTPLASLLVPYPKLMHALTFYVYDLELFAVFLLFSPVKTAWCRLLAVLLLGSMHIGFALFLSIGIFPLVSLTGLAAFIPALAWDRLPQRKNPTFYYDEACAFCRKTCRIFREFSFPSATVIPAQSVPEIYAVMQRENSWVVEDAGGARRTRWEAVAWVMRRSPLLWPLGMLFLPRVMHPLGDRLYGFIADHRGAFGRLSARLLTEHERPLAFRLRPPTRIAIAVLVCLVALWNVRSLPGNEERMPVSPGLRSAMISLRLTQEWKLFAPNPYRRSEWTVIEGVFNTGRVADLLRPGKESPSHAMPEDGYATYPNYRWRKYFSRVNVTKWRRIIGEYYCRTGRGEAREGERLREIVLTQYAVRFAGAGGETGAGPFRKQRLVYSCGGRKKSAGGVNEKKRKMGDTAGLESRRF